MLTPADIIRFRLIAKEHKLKIDPQDRDYERMKTLFSHDVYDWESKALRDSAKIKDAEKAFRRALAAKRVYEDGNYSKDDKAKKKATGVTDIFKKRAFELLGIDN